jgi:hypothetical protein
MQHRYRVLDILFHHSHDILEDILRYRERSYWRLPLLFPLFALDPPLPSRTDWLIVSTRLSQRTRDGISTSPTPSLGLGIERIQPLFIILIHTVSKSSGSRTRLFNRLGKSHIVDRFVVSYRLVKGGKVGRFNETSRVGRWDMVVERSVRGGGRGIRLLARGGRRRACPGRTRVDQGCRG